MKRKFYGRQWLFEKIHDTIEKGKNLDPPKYRGVAILGQAGSGKTSVCLQLLQPNENDSIKKELSENIIAYHFCEADNQQSLDVSQFIRNIVLQLCKHEKLANYKQQYNSSDIQDLVKKEHKNEDIINIFKKVIVDPLKACEVKNQRLLLIVDSIDESLFEGSSPDTDVITICSLLVIALQQNLLPPWLRLIITARRQSRDVMKMFSGLRKITLDDLKKSYVVKDVQQYILDRLDADPDLRKHLTRHTAEQFNLLHVKSNGCILYLEQILDNVIKGVLTIEDVSDIPGTLNGLYLWLCQRLFTEDAYNTHLRPILETLLATKQNLCFNDLISIIKLVNDGVINEKDVQDSLDTLSPMLVQEDGSYHFVHHSFSEWLIDVKHCTRRFLCNVAKGHAMLAVYFMCGGKTLTLQENERFLSHLLQSQYPSSDPTKVEQWLKWSGVRAQDAGTLGDITSESTHKLGDVQATLPHCEDESCAPKRNDDVESCAQINNNLDKEDKDCTPLLKAAHSGNCKEVHSLLQKGADVNFIDRSGKTALSVASGEGHVKIVHDLINCGAEINTRDSNGCTPLRAAARCGSSDTVTLLLKHGAIPDLADNNQRTAMRAAAWGGHTDIVLQLLQKGADPNHMDREGRTALIAAAHTGCVKTVEVLLDHEASVNHADSDGRTALAVCILSEFLKNHLDVIKVLLENGADANHPDFDGMTPLCLASMLGHKDVVQLLLERHADVGHWDRHGRTPLMLASANGHHTVVKLLLECQRGKQAEISKENFFKKDNSGWTPLLVAAFNGFESVVQLLLFYGAPLSDVDESKRTPLMLAAHEGHTVLLEQLICAGSSVNAKSSEGRTAIHYATLFGHIDCVEKLLQKEADVNVYDSHGITPLNYAAKEGNAKLCEVLLKGGAKVNCQDPSGRTPLHTAAWSGFYSVAEKLIEYGADVNHVGLMGYTPLMTAAWQGHTSVLNLLLKRNAMVDVVSSNDKATALNIAAQEGHEDVVRLLLNHSASTLADKYGRDPMKVAKQAGNRAVVNILDSFNSLSMSDGNFTNTLKRQFPKLTKATSSVENPSPVLAEQQKKCITRTTSNTSSRGKNGSEELADSNTSISSTDPSTPYDEEYSHSYCGPFGEMSTGMSSMSSLKQSKTTVLTSSTMAMDDEVFFGRSMSKDSVHKIPFDFNIAYHGCDPINLRKALEMPSTETTL
ncbi:Ankyrin repeat domain-containing 50 [Paramuricea clavata]|uniref:Ankyrin repeat domain-containing 50 n=1 Tax=Paramuricea clavata TaxID=317549 RepID=A0A6S7FJI3_PARCT|nr:Ankyrin repeat domain-containing 50 [Paramuricea clavata]